MELKPGQYYYEPWGSCFRICRKNEHGSFPYTHIDVCYSREDARKRVYELNGWKMK